MLFCPTCANLLIINNETGYNKWACNTCAYEFPITKQVRPSPPHVLSLLPSNILTYQSDDLAHTPEA